MTFYKEYDTTSVAYYAPEIEKGWYKCAISENKLDIFPPQSAAEITYNGKKIRVLVTDLCPNSENSHWTSKSNYFFDLGKNAFETLENTSKGYIDVTLKLIPYETSQNIKFEVKVGSNQWWLSGRFYNQKNPLKKVEVSYDGKNYTQMRHLDGYRNNWWVIDGKDLMSNVTFRLTDINNKTITTNKIGSLSENGKYDTGVNFPY